MQNNLQLYNSFGKKLQKFEPLKKGEVSLYVCGITPYDTTHLGHAFTYISFDVLVRYLIFLGYKVNYVQNVTDIDDDILKRAKKENRDWQELGQFWTDKFLTDLKALNIQMPMHYVKATDSIPTIIKIVSGLIEKGFAYEQAGTVYFDIKKFPSYGELSGYTEKQMIILSRERGADPEDANKKNSLDFIVWQATKPGEPNWDSPWGKGRPGWHIECSSMIYDYLGEQIDPDLIGIDIHGGGRDLIFPHHESEIAQSESFTGKKPFARTWMHTGTVFYEGEKMAKSLGNLVMVSDLLGKYSANAIRFMLLSHHWRKLWEFEDSEMDDAAEKVKMLESLCHFEHFASEESGKDPSVKPQDDIPREFIEALNNDLDIPKALEILVQKKPASLKSCLFLLGFQI